MHPDFIFQSFWKCSSDWARIFPFTMKRATADEGDDFFAPNFKRMRTGSVSSYSTPESSYAGVNEMFIPESPAKSSVSHSTSKPSTPRTPDRCSCKSTKCLKLYCVCFKQDKMCSTNCSCRDCGNLPTNSEKRNEKMKKLRETKPLVFEQQSPDGTRKRGCSCRNSKCLKNYCECFQSGSVCGTHCTCTDCGNSESSLQETLMNLLRGSTLTFKIEDIKF